jgi:hypothetical protein
MPKTVKSVNAHARVSPVKVKVEKKRKPVVIASKTTELPVITGDHPDLDDLTKFKDNTKSADVEFYGVFVRQNKFGQMEFNVPENEYEDLKGVFINDLEYESEPKCLKADDYSGHFQVIGKLSKDYKDQFKTEAEIPIPEKMTKVKVEGSMKTSMMRGKPCGYFQINNWSVLA